MKVKATSQGFFGGHLKNIGDEFEVPDGMKASWWESVATEEPVAEPVAAEDPVAEVVEEVKPAKKKKRAKKKTSKSK